MIHRNKGFLKIYIDNVYLVFLFNYLKEQIDKLIHLSVKIESFDYKSCWKKQNIILQ